MITKKTLVLLLTVFILSATQKTKASHITAGNLSYQWISGNQYLLTFRLYRDCNGIWAPGSAYICYQSANAGISGAIVCPQIPGTGTEIFPVYCFVNNGLSSCTGGSGLGVQEWVYQDTLTLPASASDWVFSTSSCCLNAGISTLLTGTNGFYVSTRLDNLTYPSNNSPQFITASIAQHCLNTLSTYTKPCIDPDGDSIVYSLTPLQQGSYTCPDTATNLVYYPGYTTTHPVSSSTPILFDPTTSEMTFTPDLLQVGALVMTVRDYRNGILIGEVQHFEMIYIVPNGIANPNWMKGKVFSDQNGNGIYDTGEQGIAGTIVEVQPGTYLGATNNYGDYAIAMSTGTFTATVPVPPLYSTVTPLIQTASFAGTFQTDSINDFAVSMIPNIQDLRVILTGGNNVSPGSNTSVNMTYKNVGSASIASGSVSLVYDSNYVYVNSNVAPDVISGDTITWVFSNLSSMSATSINVEFWLSASVPQNTPLTSQAEILPIAGDTVPQDNIDILNQLGLTPVDPNSKVVTPSGPITTIQVANGQFLEYTIYFQNTGTSPAINVFIDDTLDQNFNIPTFEVLSASHNYTWTITGPGIIKFNFDNIMLPDSGTNQLLSHVFIKYRIKPKNNLVVGDKMTNIAYIVFDNYAPLATNYTSTTVINPVSVSEHSSNIFNLIIYPNPTNNFLNIEMNLKETASLTMELFNLIGEEVWKTEKIAATGFFKKQINISEFSKGIYFLKIATAKGMNVIKIVKN